MIVVDTNIVVYLLLPDLHTPWAEAAFRREPHWVAPLLWRSEFRNTLMRKVRQAQLSLTEALRIQALAEQLFKDREYAVRSNDVLKAATTSGCSAYDCEFVVLARMLDKPLVTADRKVLTAFPDVARDLREFAEATP